MFKRVLLILALMFMITFPVFSQSGNYTTHNLFYLPEYGAYGITEYNAYNAAMEIADAQIWANKLAFGNYYLKTEIDTKFAELKFTDLADTPANYTGQAGKYVKVNAGETDLEFGTPTGAGTYLELTDTPATYDNGKYAKSTADGVVWDIPSGGYTNLTSFVNQTAWRVFYSNADGDVVEMALGTDGQYFKSTGATSAPIFDNPGGAGDMLKSVYDTDTDDIVDKSETVDDGIGNSSTAADVKDAVTKKHSQNTDTQFDFYNALSEDHTWSGDKDSQPVGESVVFGDFLYKDWATGEWMKAKADVFGTTPALRIALESKSDGQTTLMLVKGYIRDDSAFDFGASRVFLNDDVAGTADDTAPAEEGDQIQIVGTAISADVLFFDPSEDVGEI